MIYLFLLLALINTSFAGEVNFDVCSDDLHGPTKVDVVGCEADDCTLYKGKDVTFEADFESPVDTDDLTIAVSARLFGVWQPWGKAPDKICGVNIECPLKKGQKYTYKFSTPILADYPSIRTRVKYNLKTPTGENIICFTFPVSIK
ncbi:NPC intracellular cholesterol transporter 2 homolog a [Tetranychus urticae]|uniref:NPC intracellular cholesterol transporter 2 homolog a n=1 Tax=Tetranychus urticae TaxID=32264 RepID=UPI00077BBF73|nr:NPC intracellular cholesterol transporter 2 homolog a [Tetranychus urticae]